MTQNYLLYIGTYAAREAKSIHVYAFDVASGNFSFVESSAGSENPSFLAFDAQKQHLYVVSETETFGELKGGAVSAYAIEPTTGKLTFLNQQPTYGGAPCDLLLDRTNRYLLVANYNGGNVNLFPLEDDGRIGSIADNVQHIGKGINLARQEMAHPHSVVADPGGKYFFVPDLGMDRIVAYRLDYTTSKLVRHGETRLADGAGPRHMVFHPSAQYAFVINELSSTITAFAFDQARIELHALQTVATLPDDFTGESTCAEILVSPSGKFLYGSNRGHDSIVVFAIEPESGQLSYVEHVSTQGKTPRNFAIDPAGEFLFAANQDSDSVVVYAIDQATGKMTPTGKTLQVPKPVCIKIRA